MGVSIKDEKEYTFKALEKVVKPYYIAASPMAVANIGKKKISALLDNGAKVIVITADFI
jgi:hypothetical protein